MWYFLFIVRTDRSFPRSFTWARSCSFIFRKRWIFVLLKTWEHLECQRLRVKDAMAVMTFTMIRSSSFFPSSRLSSLKHQPRPWWVSLGGNVAIPLLFGCWPVLGPWISGHLAHWGRYWVQSTWCNKYSCCCRDDPQIQHDLHLLMGVINKHYIDTPLSLFLLPHNQTFPKRFTILCVYRYNQWK